MAILTARFCVGLLIGLALWVATVVESRAQSSTPSITVTSRPAQFRFVGQVMKLTFTAYSGNRVFTTATVDPRGLGPNVPDCESPPQQTGATFTCTSTYTVTPLNMASGSFSGAPILKWTAPSGSRTGANFTVPLAPPDTNPPNLILPSNITVGTDTGKPTAVVNYAVSAVDPEDVVADLLLTGGLASGGTFPLGVTTVSYSATDPSGNVTNGSFTVTVEDREAPVVSLPTDISDNAPAGATGQAVTFTATAADNADPNPTVSCAPASGSTFAIGETTVSCTAKDVAGNTSAAKTFKITINDVTPPALSVPADIAANTDPGKPTATVTYSATATDAGDPAPVVSCLPASGSAFATGETTVSCTARDASNNIAGPATFKVAVSDHEAPVVTPPADITVGTDAGVATAVVTYPNATAKDNVDGDGTVTPVVASGSLPSGSIFPLGTTTVFFDATDAAGNTGTASFKITVNDTEAPTLSLPANIVVATDPGKAGAIVTYSVSATDVVDGAVTPTQTSGLASGAEFPAGTTTVTFTATDKQGNTSSGSFTVTVQDREAPVVNVPANVTVNTETGKNTATVTYNVSATDAAGGAVTLTQTAGLASGASFPVGTTTVTWTATDSTGNVGSGSFIVTVVDAEAPELTVPANIVVDSDPGKASATVTYSVSATDAVDGAVTPVQIAGLASGASFPVGTTTVTFRATDSRGNASDPKSFTVTVTDNQAPALNVPANISVSTDAGKPTAKVTYNVSATDLVGGDVQPQLVAGLASGSDFPIGTTTVTYRAIDQQGNASAERSFTVTVADGEPPVLTVPTNITVTVAYGETSGTANWAPPTATDNSQGTVSTTQIAGLDSGSSFPLGTTTNTFEARDAAGNTATASFTVTVSTTQPGNVTFLVNSPADGSFGFSSPEPALNVAVNSSGGHGSSGAIALAPGTYAFSFTAPNGVDIASAQCSDPGSAINAASKSGKLKVVPGGNISCTISTSDSADKAVALIGSFLESRSDIIIANQPDIDRRIERLTGAYSGNGGMTAFGMPIGGSQLPIGLQIAADRTTFGYSLQRAQMSEQANEGTDQTSAVQSGTGAPGTQLPLSAYCGRLPSANAPFQHAFGPDTAGSVASTEAPSDPMARRFDVWTEGTIGRFKSGSGDGSFGIAHAGVDYLLSPAMLVGLSLQVDWLDQDREDGAAVTGVGYLVGPYATVRLSDHFYLDARAGWGQSFNQVSPLGTFNDKFDGNRWLATAALIGSFDIERWKIKPEARVTMFEEKTDAYVDGLGVDVPSVDVRTGQFAFGPSISTDMQLEGGLVMTPFVDLQGIWTFMQNNTATAATETPGLAETGLRGRAETGVALSAGNGMSINASAFYDGLGSSSYSALGGKLGLSHRF
ncbi:hypothetical protein CK221_15715 [Mesorhizobium sp. WSM3868]|nr:hypothetical protein CK221_15715 [Mesorhizobium sp. WSM3868]